MFNLNEIWSVHINNKKKMQYDPTVRFSKFTSDKEYVEFEGFLTKLVWKETLSLVISGSVNWYC